MQRIRKQPLSVSNTNKPSNPNGTELPKLFKETPLYNQPPKFTNEDVKKIIQHIVSKGYRYLLLKKALQHSHAVLLQKKLISSSFMHFTIRKELNQMGDQRRLGNGLRGFSRLLLEEFQNKCWPMIELETDLLLKQSEQKQQQQKLSEVLSLKPQSKPL